MNKKKKDYWDKEDKAKNAYVIKECRFALPYIIALANGLRVQSRPKCDDNDDWIDVDDFPNNEYLEYRILKKDSKVPRRPNPIPEPEYRGG